jgi:hypothetical protein
MPIRRLTHPEIENLTPLNVEQTQGVTGGERTLAALASSPESYRQFLESKGYQVRPYGDRWNFAVRKREGDPWQVVNPSGPDAGDIASFLADAGVAIGIGALSTLGATGGATVGAAGGPPGVVGGAVAGGAAGGAAGEAAKQGLGGLFGIPNNTDPTQIATSGAIGGAFPAAGAAISGAGRGLARAAGGSVGKEIGSSLADLGALVAGIEPLGKQFSQGQVLEKFAEIPAGSRLSLKAVSARLHNVVKRLWNKGDAQIAELVEARRLAEQGAKAGVTVDLRAPVEALDALAPVAGPEVSKTTTRRIVTEAEAKAESTLRRSGTRTDFTDTPPSTTPFDVGVRSQSAGRGVRDVRTTRTVTEAADVLGPGAAEKAISEPEMPKAIQGVVGRIRTYLGNQDLSAVDPVTATKVIRQLQKIAASKGAYGDIPIGKAFTRAVATAAHDARILTEQAMEAGGFGQYAGLMHVGAERYGYLKNMYEIAGASHDDALRYVKGVYGENLGIEALHDFEKAMGGTAHRISKAVEGAHIRRTALGPGRETPRLVPRFTAVGTPLMLASTGTAWILGGPLGAVASLALASPRTVVAVTRLVKKFGGPAVIQATPTATADFLKEAVKVLGIAAAQGAGRRIVSEDARGRRRAVFMGD